MRYFHDYFNKRLFLQITFEFIHFKSISHKITQLENLFCYIRKNVEHVKERNFELY